MRGCPWPIVRDLIMMMRGSSVRAATWTRPGPWRPLILYHCHHLYIAIHVSFMSPLGVFSSDASSVSRHAVLLLSALQRSTSYSYILLPSPVSHFGPVRCLLYHPRFIRVNVIPIHPNNTARMCMCMFHSYPSSSQFDRHPAITSIAPSVHVLFISLVSI